MRAHCTPRVSSIVGMLIRAGLTAWARGDRVYAILVGTGRTGQTVELAEIPAEIGYARALIDHRRPR